MGAYDVCPYCFKKNPSLKHVETCEAGVGATCKEPAPTTKQTKLIVPPKAAEKPAAAEVFEDVLVCGGCGAEISRGQIFCSVCGGVLQWESEKNA